MGPVQHLRQHRQRVVHVEYQIGAECDSCHPTMFDERENHGRSEGHGKPESKCKAMVSQSSSAAFEDHDERQQSLFDENRELCLDGIHKVVGDYTTVLSRNVPFRAQSKDVGHPKFWRSLRHFEILALQES